MQAHQDAHGKLPSAVVYGKHGKPLLSWRVSLLPFLEEDKLYKKFRLDEAWDSPHNIKLLDQMPYVYASPDGKRDRIPPDHTVVQVFVGPGTAFEGSEGLHLFRDLPDGAGNTILIIEGGPPVPWTKPADISFENGKNLPRLATLFTDGFRIAFADGSAIFVSNDTSEATIRAWITRNGGEKPE